MRQTRIAVVLLLLATTVQGYYPCPIGEPCPQPQTLPTYHGTYGLTVSRQLLSADATSFQSYNSRVISFMRKRGDLIEFGDSAGQAMIGVKWVPGTGRARVYVNTVYFGYLDSANAAWTTSVTQALVRDNRITPIKMVPSVLPAGNVGFWTDLQGAWDAGGANTACNIATLEAMSAMSAYLWAALHFQFGLLPGLWAAYIVAAEAQAQACGRP